jgi:hypothetical protein
MLIISLATNLLFILMSFCIAYFALKFYIISPYNNIDGLYWGLSFFFAGTGYIIYLINSIFYIHNNNIIAFIIHLNDTFVFFLQTVIALKIAFVYKDNLKTMRYKTLRVIMSFLFIFFTSFSIYKYSFIPIQELDTFLQTIGNKVLDIGFETLHVFSSFLIALVLPNVIPYKFVRFGFIFIGVSEILQILNIIFFSYQINYLFIFEWAITIIGMLAITTGLFIIYYLKDIKKEKRKAVRRIRDRLNSI